MAIAVPLVRVKAMTESAERGAESAGKEAVTVMLVVDPSATVAGLTVRLAVVGAEPSSSVMTKEVPTTAMSSALPVMRNVSSASASLSPASSSVKVAVAEVCPAGMTISNGSTAA